MSLRGFFIGNYRHRVHIQRPVYTQDPDTGEALVTWETVEVSGVGLSSVPADVLTGPGRESRTSGTTTAEVSLRVNLRWFPGFDPSWRILWNGFAYDVRSVETDASARREYRLSCINPREQVAQEEITDGFLLESGGFILLESGGFLIQE